MWGIGSLFASLEWGWGQVDEDSGVTVRITVVEKRAMAMVLITKGRSVDDEGDDVDAEGGCIDD